MEISERVMQVMKLYSNDVSRGKERKCILVIQFNLVQLKSATLLHIGITCDIQRRTRIYYF